MPCHSTNTGTHTEEGSLFVSHCHHLVADRLEVLSMKIHLIIWIWRIHGAIAGSEHRLVQVKSRNQCGVKTLILVQTPLIGAWLLELVLLFIHKLVWLRVELHELLLLVLLVELVVLNFFDDRRIIIKATIKRMRGAKLVCPLQIVTTESTAFIVKLS